MLEHLESGFDLRDVARVAGLESHYFSTFFRKRVGVAFSQWVAMQRVHRAQLLLQGQDMAITTVAFAVGFGSLRTFERAFQKHSGCSAKVFREKIRAAIQP